MKKYSTLEEVQREINSLVKELNFKDKKYNCFSAIKKLDESKITLDNIILSLSSDLNKEKTKTYKKAKDLNKKIKNHIKNLYEITSTASLKKVDEDFKIEMDNIIKYLKSNLDGRYRSLKIKSLANTIKSKKTYLYTIIFKDIVDDSEYIHPKFKINIICSKVKNNINIKISSNVGIYNNDSLIVIDNYKNLFNEILKLLEMCNIKIKKDNNHD